MGRGTHAIRENAKPGHAGTGAPWPILCAEDSIIFGSSVVQTDFDGAVVWQGDYAPFGESLEEQPINWGNPYTFLGNEDDGGLMDFNARFYDARIGRFTSPDPILNLSSSQTVNPYVYCRNNPLRYTDPLGLAPQEEEQGTEPGEGGGGGGGGEGIGRNQNAWNIIPQSSGQLPPVGGGCYGGDGGQRPIQGGYGQQVGQRASGKNGYFNPGGGDGAPAPGSPGGNNSTSYERGNGIATVPDGSDVPGNGYNTKEGLVFYSSSGTGAGEKRKGSIAESYSGKNRNPKPLPPKPPDLYEFSCEYWGGATAYCVGGLMTAATGYAVYKAVRSGDFNELGELPAVTSEYLYLEPVVKLDDMTRLAVVGGAAVFTCGPGLMAFGIGCMIDAQLKMNRYFKDTIKYYYDYGF